MNKIHLSVVIPSFNEEKRIPQTLSKIISYLKDKGFNYEIIVVDDGSSDKTLSSLNNFDNIITLKNEKNMGKGYSVRRGVLEAKGEYILFSDADLSTPIEESEKLLQEIKENDVVIGSRGYSESQILVRQPWWREQMGKIFNTLISLFVIKGFKDTQCGFKLFKNEVAKKIFKISKINGFAFDVEIIFIAKKMGLKVMDIPVTWINSKESKVNPIAAPLEMICELIKIKINDLMGKYEIDDLYQNKMVCH